MTLWGKTPQQLQTERDQMLFEREEIARRDQEVRDRRIAKMIHDQGGVSNQRPMTPEELGAKYAMPRTVVLQQEAVRSFHFGTDVPVPTWREVEEARARSGEEDAGVSILGIMAIAAIVLALAFGILYLALT